MRVVLRERPIASPTHRFVPLALPVLAVLAGPRLSPLTRSVQQHIRFEVVLIVRTVACNLIGDSVIYLKIARFDRLSRKGVELAITLKQGVLKECLIKCC